MYKTRIQKYETCTVLSLYFDTYVQFLSIFNTDDLPQINFVLQLQKVLLFHTCQELLHCCDVLSLSILLVPSLHCQGFHSMFLTHLPVKLVHMRMSRPMAFYLQWEIIRVINIFSKAFSWQSMKFFNDVQAINQLYTSEKSNDKKFRKLMTKNKHKIQNNNKQFINSDVTCETSYLRFSLST